MISKELMPKEEVKNVVTPSTCSQNYGTFAKIPVLTISLNHNNALEWKKWWQNFELFLLATNYDAAPEKRKVAILLHTIGERGLEVYNSFNLNIEKVTLEQVRVKYKNYFEPLKKITMIRDTFFTRTQKSDESIVFVMMLNKATFFVSSVYIAIKRILQ